MLMRENESADILRGTTLDVYRFILKKGKAVGVREVQRALNLSSPSIAVYHLSKLEDHNLVRRENGNYAVDKIILEASIRISSLIVPKYLFYSIISVVFLIIELTTLTPSTLTADYFFFTLTTAILSYFFCYETAKVWLKGAL